MGFPEKDHPILNFRNRGTWIAHGALIENINIAATAFGYEAQIQVFPNGENTGITGRINFKKTEKPKDELFDSILLRATNRKPYKDKILTVKQKREFLISAQEINPNCDIRITEDKLAKNILGSAVSVNEVVMLENEKLHQLFFDEIVWTKEEESKKQKGLYLKTMELGFPQRTALRLFKHWSIMKIANKFGVAKKIANDNAKTYSASSIMGIIIVDDTDKGFIDAGRIIERLWLKATNEKLEFHLITGVMFFYQRVMSDPKGFSPVHIELIKKTYNQIKEVFKVEKGVIAGLFRIGEDGKPTARSIKSPPEFIKKYV